MPVQIRLRHDHVHIASTKAMRAERVLEGESPEWCTQEEWDSTPAAQPGDLWRTRWYKRDEAGNRIEGPIAGYHICCIKCKDVHGWTTATNCSSRRATPSGGVTCDHMGNGSCWVWTGSAEEGTLTASPSLHCQLELGGCGYHGWLQNGILSDG